METLAYKVCVSATLGWRGVGWYLKKTALGPFTFPFRGVIERFHVVWGPCEYKDVVLPV